MLLTEILLLLFLIGCNVDGSDGEGRAHDGDLEASASIGKRLDDEGRLDGRETGTALSGSIHSFIHSVIAMLFLR